MSPGSVVNSKVRLSDRKKRRPIRQDSEKAQRVRNLPAAERYVKGGITVKNNMAKVDEPLRIDKLRKNGIIDEMQHLYGLQIITLWTIAQRPFTGMMQYGDTPRGSGVAIPELTNITRMDGNDQFYKTMLYLAFPRSNAMQDAGKRYLDAKRRKHGREMLQAEKDMDRIFSRRNKAHDIIGMICFKEMGVVETGKALKISARDLLHDVRDAFDRLGDALAKMRAKRKEIAEDQEPISNAAEILSPA
jgi:hypothetical protein